MKSLLFTIFFFVPLLNPVCGQIKLLERDLASAGINESQRKSLITALDSLIELQRKRRWRKIYSDSIPEMFSGSSKEEFIKARLNYKPNDLENNLISFVPVSIWYIYRPSDSDLQMSLELYGCGTWRDGRKKHRQDSSVKAYWKEGKLYLREVELKPPILTGTPVCR